MTEYTAIKLNDIYFKKYPTTEFRFFGMYFEKLDLKNIELVYNAQNICIDSFKEVGNVEALTTLPNLKSLIIDVELLKEYNFLSKLNSGLLGIGINTNKRSFNLDNLRKFQDLKVLSIGEYKQGLDAIGELTSLSHLSFYGFTVENFNFAEKLKFLKVLSLSGGNTHNFEALYFNETIEILNAFHLSKVTDLEVLSHIKNLKSVQLSQLKNVPSFPNLNNSNINHIWVDNMKSLTDFSMIENTPHLISYMNTVCPSSVAPNDIIPVLRNKTLKQVRFGMRGKKKDDEVINLIESFGKQDEENSSMFNKLLDKYGHIWRK